ncbi:expressed protein [Phakopsora pachyrhizi]|uniref:Expressed protein n=1 Tax=Phakopsora pachyrhizi TaxID=170000 RepID=A0AAV0BMM7_PHAPC|nr:expressed protein [Phakopsora pachyrhizi]
MRFLLNSSWLLIASLELSIDGMYLGDKSLVLNDVVESYEPSRLTVAHDLPQIHSMSTIEHTISPPNVNGQEPWVTVNQSLEQISTQGDENNYKWPYDDSLTAFHPSNSLSAHIPSNMDSLSKNNFGSSNLYDSVKENSQFNTALNRLWFDSNTDQLNNPESDIGEAYNEIIQNYLMHEQIYGSFSDQLQMTGDQPAEFQKPETFPNAFTNNTDVPPAHNVGSEIDWISFFGLKPSFEVESASNIKDYNSIGTSEISTYFFQQENIKKRNREGINLEISPDIAAYSHLHNKSSYFPLHDSRLSIESKDKIKNKKSPTKIEKAKASGSRNSEYFFKAQTFPNNGKLFPICDENLRNLDQSARSFRSKYNVRSKKLKTWLSLKSLKMKNTPGIGINN